MRFNASGSEQMRLTSTGLGIGTSSPAAKLDVTGTFNGTQAVFGNTSGRGLLIGTALNGGVNEGSSVLNARGAGNGQFLFQTDGTLRMTLTDSGNLGIGTTTPAYKLTVEGTLAAKRSGANQYIGLSTNSGEGYFDTINTLSTDNIPFYFRQTNNSVTSTRMTLDASGRLGIGETSPTSRLVVGSVSDASNFLRINSSTVQTVFGSDANGGYVGTDNSYALRFFTNNTERARIDSSGNFGLGTTSPSSYGKFAVSAAGTPTTAYASILSGAGTYNGGFESTFYVGAARTDIVDNGVVVGWRLKTLNANASSGTYLSFESANSATGAFAPPTTFTERARIDSSGNLLVGRTTQTAADSKIAFTYNAASNWGLGIQAGTQDGGSAVVFVNTSGSTVGSISQATSSVSYNTTSDQRLKENIVDAESASALIDAIQVRQYNWKSDGSHQRYGFIAQELVTVAPEAVHQPTDTDEMMAVDYSKLVPMLVKEIQSLRQRVAQLESN
jgi:hypothetical protein